MPDLSAYLDFSVKLDFINDETVITDTSTYPVGVAAGITGIVKITQPDGIIVQGVWTAPDVTWDGTMLTPAVKELRRTAQNNAQCGTYTMEYTVDHADYSPTTKVKSFELNYTKPTVVIDDNFDVFTPFLELVDDTDYDVSGFTKTVSRDWSVDVGTVTTLTGTGSSLDLIYSGDYYDAVYLAQLVSTLSYAHTVYTYLTVDDEITTNETFEANTPPTISELIECLTDLYVELQSATCSAAKCLKDDYEYAASLHHNLIEKLRLGDTEHAYEILTSFIATTHCDHGVNRNHPILPYDLSGAQGSNWLVYNYIAPSDLTEFTIPTLVGKMLKGIKASGIGRRFVQQEGDFSVTIPEDTYWFKSSTGKFTYLGGTIFIDTWFEIYYTNS